MTQRPNQPASGTTRSSLRVTASHPPTRLRASGGTAAWCTSPRFHRGVARLSGPLLRLAARTRPKLSGTRASNRFDLLARSIRSNLPQCLTTGAMRRIDLACRLTETVAELVSSRFAFKATGPAPQLQLLFWLSHCHARSSDCPFASLYYSVPPRGAVTPARGFELSRSLRCSNVTRGNGSAFHGHVGRLQCPCLMVSTAVWALSRPRLSSAAVGTV